jgi:DNA-binding MarR family transcriptional regulator
MPKHDDSMTRRLLRFLADDEGRYTLSVLADELDDERERLFFVVRRLSIMGLVTSLPYPRATRRGDRVMYEITDAGRAYLSEEGRELLRQAARNNQGAKGRACVYQATARAFAFRSQP